MNTTTSTTIDHTALYKGLTALNVTPKVKGEVTNVYDNEIRISVTRSSAIRSGINKAAYDLKRSSKLKRKAYHAAGITLTARIAHALPFEDKRKPRPAKPAKQSSSKTSRKVGSSMSLTIGRVALGLIGFVLAILLIALSGQFVYVGTGSSFISIAIVTLYGTALALAIPLLGIAVANLVFGVDNSAQAPQPPAASTPAQRKPRTTKSSTIKP